MSRLKASRAPEEEEELWSWLGRADSESVRASSGVTPAGTWAVGGTAPKRPPRPEVSNPGGTGVSPGNDSGSGGGTAAASVVLSGRVGEGWVLRPEPPGKVLPAEAPTSPAALAPPALSSLVTTAPAGEGAGAVVLVEPGAVVVVDDDGRVSLVDRPEPPEDGMDVLVVELPGRVVVVEELEEVVAPDSLSAGAVVVVVEGSVGGSVGVVVVVVVGSVGGSVVRVVSTVVDVALPPPGSGSPSSARAGPAETQTTATHTVARAIARRTRLSITRVSWVRGGTATL